MLKKLQYTAKTHNLTVPLSIHFAFLYNKGVNSKTKNLVRKTLLISIPILLIFYSANSFGQAPNLSKRDLSIPNLCPTTKSILKFNWFKKVFHPCQTFSEVFTVSNECFDKQPFKLSMSAVISLSDRGVELYFTKLRLNKIPPSWGNKVFLGFKILDTNRKMSLKVKEKREISVDLHNHQFIGRPKQIMTIYGPQKEGGQDKYDNLIENELERVNDGHNFRFYLRVSNKDRGIVIVLPGPILENLPQKIKQRNTCH